MGYVRKALKAKKMLLHTKYREGLFPCYGFLGNTNLRKIIAKSSRKDY